MNVADLEPRLHEPPPPGWPVEVFERVTDAIAAALVSAALRQRDREDEEPAR